MWKKLAPPSSEYFPASSATPKVVLEAAPARVRAAQAHARTAVIRHMPLSSADQGTSLSTASRSFPGPEADRVVRRQAGLLLGGGDRRARLLLGHPRGVEGDRRDLGGPQLQRHPLVQVDQLRQAHDRRRRRVALDHRPPHLVAEHVQVRRAPVDQPDRHAGVDRDAGSRPGPRPRAGRPAPRPRPRGARRRRRGNRRRQRRPRSPSRRSRSRSARSGRRPSSGPACVPRGRARRSPSSSRSRSRSRPSGRSSRRRRGSLPLPCSGPAGGSRRSRSSTPCSRRELREPGMSCRRTCRPFSRSSPFETQVFSSSCQSPGKRPPCVTTPTSAVFGLEAERLVDACRRSGRRPRSPPPAASRASRRPIAPVAHDPARSLRVVRIVREPFSEDQVLACV